MLTPTKLILPAFLLVGVLAVCGCGKSASVPGDIRVLHEGVILVTPDKPFGMADMNPKGSGQYEYVIEIKVTAGDAVEVVSWQDSAENKEGTPLKRLSTVNPVKEISLTDRVGRSDTVQTTLKINVKTTGKSSDVSLKITKQLDAGK